LAGFTHQPIPISALKGEGLDALRRAIGECGFGFASSDGAVVTSARHYQALCEASSDLGAASDALKAKLPGDLLAEDLRSAISALGSIFGEITSDELLGEIFSKFCIGK
jgi:tRNA modification GTPase